MPELVPEPLTREAFAPFGDVVDSAGTAGAPANHGTARRYPALAGIEIRGRGARTVIGIFETRPVRLPFHLLVMERHPLGSQAFQPLREHPWLLVVATDPRRPDGYRAFLAGGRQGIAYRPGVWHHFLLSPEHPGRFLVVDREGPGGNLEECAVWDLDLFLPPLPG